MLTWLGHWMPRYMFKLYSRCVSDRPTAVHYCRLCKLCPISPPQLSSHRVKNRILKQLMLLCEQGCKLDLLKKMSRNELGRVYITIIMTVRSEWKVTWGSVGIRNQNGERKKHKGLSWQRSLVIAWGTIIRLRSFVAFIKKNRGCLTWKGIDPKSQYFDFRNSFFDSSTMSGTKGHLWIWIDGRNKT